MNANELVALSKDAIADLSKTLTATNIKFLVQTLNEKDDKLRYTAFLLLKSSSQSFPYVYQYWDELEDKLGSDNSYQRSLGVMLIAENVRWDKDLRFGEVISKYLGCCNDEKFITARQTIQGLATIAQTTSKYNDTIKQRLVSLELSQYKANQQNLLSKDISNVLKIVSATQ